MMRMVTAAETAPTVNPWAVQAEGQVQAVDGQVPAGAYTGCSARTAPVRPR